MPKPTAAEILINAWTEAPLDIPINVSFRKGKVTLDVADFGYVTLTAQEARDLAEVTARRVNEYPLLYRTLRYLPGFLRAVADRATGLGR